MFKFLCKWIGHSFSQGDLLVAKIKSSDLNRGRVENILKCRRCGYTLNLNDMKAIDKYLDKGKKNNR